MFRWLLRFFPVPDLHTRLLREHDEVLVMQVEHHWVVYIRAYVELVASLGLVALALVAPGSLAAILLVAAVIVYGFGAYHWLKGRLDVFLVTNIRICRAHGVLNRNWATMPLTRILDVAVDQPIIGRMLGYGHLTFENAAQEQALRTIHHIGAPDERDRTIQGFVQAAQGRPRVV